MLQKAFQQSEKVFRVVPWILVLLFLGGVSDCVCIIMCLFIVYEYACNFGIGFHFQKQPKTMPKKKVQSVR